MVMVKVPARPGLDPSRVRSDNPSGQPKGPSRVRSVRASARRSSFPRESTPSSPDPPESRPVEGSFGPSPGQPKGRSVKVSARRGFVRSPSPGQQRAVPSRSRPVRGSARQRSGPPEPRPVKGPVRPSLGPPEFLPGRVAPPLHVRVPTAPFPLSSPFMSSSSPLPLRRLLPLRRPAPPSCVPVRLSRRGRDSTAGGGIARAKMWNGISGAERRAAAASGAPLPRPPGSRPEPTPGRQTSRERGGRGIPEKEKQRAGKGFRAEGAETGEAAKRQSREGKTGGAMPLYRDETEQR